MSNGLTRIEMDALNAVRDMNRKMKDQRDIDWEQRRYEIARDVLARNLKHFKDLNVGTGDQCRIASELSVLYADALIAELKKGGEE